MEALKEAELQRVVDSLKDEYPELNEKPKSTASKRRRPMASTASSPKQKVRKKSEEMPGPMLMAISETSRTSDSHAPLSDEEHIQNPILLASLKQKLANEDLSIEDRVKIWKLKHELKEMELDTVYKHQEKKVKSLKEARTFLSPESLETKYNKIQAKVEEERAIVVRVYKDCLILFLVFETKSDFEHFWVSYTSGRLSDTLSKVLTTDQMQRLMHGDQLVHVVRTLVLKEDYRAWRDFFRTGLDCTTSADNLLALPSPSRQVDRSSLSSLDLAMVTREDQPCTDGTSDISTLNFTAREFQKALKSCREKSQQQQEKRQIEVHLETTSELVQEITRLKKGDEKAQRIILEQKQEIKKLHQTNRNAEAQLEYWLHAKLKEEAESKGEEYRQDLEETQSGPLEVEDAALPYREQAQAEDHQKFEEALKKALKDRLLPPWQGAEGDQQAFIDELSRNTAAKAEFHRLCKRVQDTQYGSEKLGKRGNLQSVPPPEV